MFSSCFLLTWYQHINKMYRIPTCWWSLLLPTYVRENLCLHSQLIFQKTDSEKVIQEKLCFLPILYHVFYTTWGKEFPYQKLCFVENKGILLEEVIDIFIACINLAWQEYYMLKIQIIKELSIPYTAIIFSSKLKKLLYNYPSIIKPIQTYIIN